MTDMREALIDQDTLSKWIEWARHDDWHRLFVGSDIRVMLGEIDRLRAALDAPPVTDMREALWLAHWYIELLEKCGDRPQAKLVMAKIDAALSAPQGGYDILMADALAHARDAESSAAIARKKLIAALAASTPPPAIGEEEIRLAIASVLKCSLPCACNQHGGPCADAARAVVAVINSRTGNAANGT